jgi:hypothetical protein
MFPMASVPFRGRLQVDCERQYGRIFPCATGVLAATCERVIGIIEQEAMRCLRSMRCARCVRYAGGLGTRGWGASRTVYCAGGGLGLKVAR